MLIDAEWCTETQTAQQDNGFLWQKSQNPLKAWAKFGSWRTASLAKQSQQLLVQFLLLKTFFPSPWKWCKGSVWLFLLKSWVQIPGTSKNQLLTDGIAPSSNIWDLPTVELCNTKLAGVVVTVFSLSCRETRSPSKSVFYRGRTLHFLSCSS